MKLKDPFYLTYCTNIHPGESWEEVWESLKKHTLVIKEHLSPDKPFGIGLRISHRASEELVDADALKAFKAWLDTHHMYVFTMNGFPYGGFHRQRVKDEVHKPDWTTSARLAYTVRLFDILAALLPEGMEGGISTSPISYKHWFQEAQSQDHAMRVGCEKLTELAFYLYELSIRKKTLFHLDIEPEPDGLLENTDEVIDFYKNYLIPIGTRWLKQYKQIEASAAEALLYRHIQLCYDICHFAVGYETPSETFARLDEAGIAIGKIQISAALRAALPQGESQRKPIKEAFEKFNESTYLHQVVAKDTDGKLVQYPDLPEALPYIYDPSIIEWRSHFHVPLFVKSYQHLQSTQEYIEQVLAYLSKKPISKHLEVETYTWEVLPQSMQVDLTTSITRELQWVKERLK